jgi:hypothetical protein
MHALCITPLSMRQKNQKKKAKKVSPNRMYPYSPNPQPKLQSLTKLLLKRDIEMNFDLRTNSVELPLTRNPDPSLRRNHRTPPP